MFQIRKSAVFVLIAIIALGLTAGSSQANAQLFMGPSNLNNRILTLQQQLNQLKAQQIIQDKVQQLKLTGPVLAYDHQKNCAVDEHTPTNYKTYLTHFACGHVTVLANGTVVRKFTLIADDFNGTGAPYIISTNVFGIGKPTLENKSGYQPVIFHGWTFNGSIPGPTLRVTAGDHVQLTLINAKDSAFPHSLHMHSMHPGIMDGMSGAAGMVEPGGHFIYNFTAAPVGVYPYHCHMFPVEEHISRGLYGMLIIDPITPRPPAVELVGMLNSYSFSFQGLNGSGHFTPTLPATYQQMKQNLSAVESADDEGNGPDNQFYSINGMPFGYIGPNEVHLQTHKEYRMYLANMVEFDPANSFHIHGTLGTFTESGTLNSSKVYTDIVLLQQGDRGIFEFSYPYAGQFMFHSHINHFSDLGWTGFFNVTDSGGPLFTSMDPYYTGQTNSTQVPISTSSPTLSHLAGGAPAVQEVPK